LNNENLNEQKSVKSDWKQWIPVLGFGQMFYDNIIGQPAINDLFDENGKPHVTRFLASAGYHGVVTFYLIYKLLE
jgi:hypothetical protein